MFVSNMRERQTYTTSNRTISQASENHTALGRKWLAEYEVQQKDQLRNRNSLGVRRPESSTSPSAVMPAARTLPPTATSWPTSTELTRCSSGRRLDAILAAVWVRA